MLDQNHVHPHKALIDMWTSDTRLKIEYRQGPGHTWKLVTSDNGPRWNPNFEYRLKREPVDKYLVAYKTKDGLAAVSNRYYTNMDDFKGSTSFSDRLEWAELIIATRQSMEA